MKGIRSIVIWGSALLAIAAALLFFESDFLWKVQQYNLFLYSSLFFKQMMVVPGGMLSYLGTFFTQFFYYPWMGVLMLCGWWGLLIWLTKSTFQIPDRWIIITLIPVAILLVANMDLGYWIYVLKLNGYFFSATIGTTVAIALLGGYRCLNEKLEIKQEKCIVILVYILMVCAIGYPLMGVYALATVLLMGIWTWRLSKKVASNIIISIVALLTAVIVPLLYYRYVYYQTNIHDIYLTALPVFTETETLLAYYIPYYLLALYFLLLTIIPQISISNKRSIVLQSILLIIMAAGIWHFWYKDDNFHHELRMQRCIEQADWQGVLEEGNKQEEEPTRSIVMMHNLALSRLGLQCDQMYSFPKGSKKANTTLPIFMYNTAGRLIYYHYGVMNECHRMCMEEGVEYGWSVELLQYMARTALFTNETQVARKYLEILRQTQYYEEWADHMESLIVNSDLLVNDMETGPITHMLHYPDIQSQGDTYVEKNLMTMLSKVDANDPYFQEQAVLAALWTRDMDDFWARFEQYLDLHPDSNVPRIFQEAAYLFGKMEQLDFVEELPIDRGVKENLQSFIQLMQQCQGKPSSQMKEYLRQRYGTTYYFEYFFLKDITYY